jgi:hypothetical protein
MDNAKAEKVLKRVEVVASVKQRMALSQTKVAMMQLIVLRT